MDAEIFPINEVTKYLQQRTIIQQRIQEFIFKFANRKLEFSTNKHKLSDTAKLTHFNGLKINDDR